MHHACLVIAPKGTKNMQEYLDTALAPFDERKEVPHVVMTREEAVADFEKRKVEHPDLQWDNLLQYMDEWYGYIFDENGNAISNYNPLSKWDWWRVGGRYSGILLSKTDGEFHDILPFGDTDFDGMVRANIEDAKGRWEQAKGKDRLDRFMLGISTDNYQENMAEASIKIITYSVLTKDGEYIERRSQKDDTEGKWLSDYYERFLSGLDAEDILAIVDMHI